MESRAKRQHLVRMCSPVADTHVQMHLISVLPYTFRRPGVRAACGCTVRNAPRRVLCTEFLTFATTRKSDRKEGSPKRFCGSSSVSEPSCGVLHRLCSGSFLRKRAWWSRLPSQARMSILHCQGSVSYSECESLGAPVCHRVKARHGLQ